MDSRLGSLHPADPDPRGALRLLAAQALGPQPEPAEDLTQAFASFGTSSRSARPPGALALGFGFGLGSGPTGPRPDWASSVPTGGVRSTPVSPRHSPPPPTVRTSGFTQVLGFDVAPPAPRGAPGVRRNTSSSGAAFTFSSTPASPSGAANRGRAPTAAASPAGPADAPGDFAGFAVPSFLSSRTPPLGGPAFRRSRFGSDDTGVPIIPALPVRPTTTGSGGARFGLVTASVSAPTSAGASSAGDSDDSSSAPVSPFGGGALSGGGGVVARGPFAVAHASPFTAGGLGGGGADGGASPLRAVTEGLDGADSGGGADVSSGGGGMAEAMECEPSVALGVDVSLGLKSAVHCTADGHVSVVGEHGRGNGGVSQALAAAAAEAAGPPTPPEACLALGRRYLAALFEAVSYPTGAVPDHAAAEFRALLAPAVELRAGPDGGGGGPGGGAGARAEPRKGVEAFLEWLHTDATAYDSWRMSLLSAAAPPGGGEVFLWVAEQARNVGPLLGRVPPSNRTSRSLTLHRLVVDPSGRVAQVWARYQLFDEMRSLLLAPHPHPSKPQPADIIQPSSDQQQAAAAGAWGSAGSDAAAGLGLGGGTGDAAAGEGLDGGGGGGGGRWPPARAPDLSALPCVQRLMAGLAAAAEGGGGGGAGIGGGGGMGGGGPQGEGALAQAQAAFAVLAASPTPIRAAAAAPADPTTHAAAAASSADAPWPPVLRGGATSPSPSRASPGLGLGLGEGGLVADFEAQAGRSVATWLGLVDSSYSGVRDVYGCTAEGLQLWEALGMWRHLGPARGREQVLEQTQRLHTEYDIRIKRGTWAVDRAGRVAYCAWEASARPRLPSPGSGSGSGSMEAGAAAGGEGSGSMLDPGAWLPAGVAVGDVVSGGGAGAGGVSGGGDVLSGSAGAGVGLSPPPPRAVEWEAGPEAAEAEGVLGHPVEWTSVDVLGLSPLGHVEEVIMYRTPLPGEAEGVFRVAEEVDGEMAPQGPAA